MNKYYNYICYNFQLRSKESLGFLPQFDETKDVSEFVLELICYSNRLYQNEKIYLSSNKNQYIIESPFASYTIDLERNEIKAYYENKIELESTLYNLPISIVAQNRNDILLHASSVEYRNGVIAFCADKGIGKTTFVSHLSKYLNFYSDDTLYLTQYNNGVSCFSSGLPFKMNFDTFRSHSSEKSVYEKSNNSLQNKKYIQSQMLGLKHIDTFKSLRLKNIFFLRRVMKEKEVEIININNEIHKKSLLLNNIVGIKYLEPEHVKRIYNSPLFLYIVQNIDFKYVDIRDNLSDIQEISTIFYNYIKEEGRELL